MTGDPRDADPPADRPPDPRTARPASRSPIDRLRDVGDPPSPRPRPSGPPRSPGSPRPPLISAEPDLPPPAVIAVGDRPGAYPGPGEAGQPGRGPSDARDARADTVVPDPEHLDARRRAGRRSSGGSFLKELPLLLVIAVVLALVIKTFLVQAFFIPSGSMQQTLHINDRVLVNKLDFRTGTPQRGEIVVFNTAGTKFGTAGIEDGDYTPCPASNGVVSAIRTVQRFVGVGTCGQDDFIKRIIAVPGDTIQCCTAGGQVLLDGKPLAEPYLYEPGVADVPGTTQPSQAAQPFCAATETVAESPSEQNPFPNSCTPTSKPITVPAGMYWVMGDHRNDSEDSRYNGFVPRDKLLGRAFVRIWPLGRFGFLRVPSSFAHVDTAAAGLSSIAGTPVLAAPALAIPLVGGRLLRRRRTRLRALARR